MKGKKISVLGCGWLGVSLIKELVDRGVEVKGSTTTPAKLKKLEALGVMPFLLNLDHLNNKNVQLFLNGSDVLIINVPPRRKVQEVESYASVLEKLLSYIGDQQKVVFVSSTSVYQNTNGWVNEDLCLAPETKSGNAIYAAEQSLSRNLKSRLTIVRFAGLVGNGRHPGRFLAGKKNLPNAKAPVNIIHQKDCIGLILRIIEKDFWGEVVNGVASAHPLREDFYKQAAQVLDLIKPNFQQNGMTSYKLVSNTKSVNQLGYTYLYDNPMEVI